MSAIIDTPETSQPRHDWEKPTASNAAVLLHCLGNTLRLAQGPGEVFGILRFISRMLFMRRGNGADQDQTIRLGGVTHVLGLGTGELLLPQEVYSGQGYHRLPDFVPSQGSVVLDAGANAGVYAVQQARRGALVYAFEPNPDCFRRLMKAVRANDLERRVVAQNCALGVAPGSADLVLPHGITTMGSLRPAWSADAAPGGIRVEVDTIDRIVRRLGLQRIDLLKIDVEGFELDVLGGARETLPIVTRAIVEYHSLDLGRRVASLLEEGGLRVVLDERMYHGPEHANLGVGRGLLFATRQSGSPGAVTSPEIPPRQ